MFSALRALVMVPFQYPSPDQLVMVWSGDYWPLSSADFKDLLEKSTSFTDFGAYAPRTANVGSGKPEAVSSVVCTSGVLRAFGVRPKLGRWLEPADDEKGAAPVAVISHALWQKSFGGDPGLIDVEKLSKMKGRLELLGPNGLLCHWRYTIGRSPLAHRLANRFQRLHDGELSGGDETGEAPTTVCPSCGAILAAAEAARCTRLWSEDFAPGSLYGLLRVENPLAE